MPAGANPARLFVPGFEGGIEAFRWRMKLINREGLYPVDKIARAAQAAQEKKLDPQILAEMVTSARSADFALDEIEIADPFGTKVLPMSPE